MDNPQRSLNKQHIVYKTTNLINNKIYIGVHKGTDKSYLGSGKALKKAVAKYGKSNFYRETLHSNLTEVEAYIIEEKLVTKDFIKLRTNYNLTPGGKTPPKATKTSTFKACETRKIKYGKPEGLITSKEVRDTIYGNSLLKYGTKTGFLNNPESDKKRENTIISKYGKLAGQMHTNEARNKSEKTKKYNRYIKLKGEVPILDSIIKLKEVESNNTIWEGPIWEINLDLNNPNSFYRNFKLIKSVFKKLETKDNPVIRIQGKKFLIILTENSRTFND